MHGLTYTGRLTTFSQSRKKYSTRFSLVFPDYLKSYSRFCEAKTIQLVNLWVNRYSRRSNYRFTHNMRVFEACWRFTRSRRDSKGNRPVQLAFKWPNRTHYRTRRLQMSLVKTFNKGLNNNTGGKRLDRDFKYTTLNASFPALITIRDLFVRAAMKFVKIWHVVM